jgi:hypothetical protein
VAFVHAGQVLIWEQTAHAVGLFTPVFTVLVYTIGGLIAGVLVRIFSDHRCIKVNDE